MRVTEPLRAEHRKLRPAIDELKAVAGAVGRTPPAELRSRLEAAHRFLTDEVAAHADAEEVAMYPTVGRLLGGARATASMSRDHVEILRLTERLGAVLGGRLALDEDEERELRAILYGLHAILRLHLAKEEEVYLPLLDEHLTDVQAAAMFDAMARAHQGAFGVAASRHT